MKIDVKQSANKNALSEYLPPIFFLIIITMIAISPAKYSNACFLGLSVWAKILVPSILPFFILTKLFSSSNLIFDISNGLGVISKKLYKTPPITSYIFFMSIISGYPVGAKLISDIYNKNQISKQSAQKALSFCTNSGPMFILGSVGIGMLNNKGAGIVILFSHIFGALLNGIIYRNLSSSDYDKKIELKPSATNLAQTVNESVTSILLIGGVVCFCFVIIEALTTNNIYLSLIENMGSFGQVFTAIFSGLLEITKGCLLISSLNFDIKIITIICTFIITFGGMSTILQSMAFTNNIISSKKYILMKFTHALCSSFFAIILLLLFNI